MIPGQSHSLLYLILPLPAFLSGHFGLISLTRGLYTCFFLLGYASQRCHPTSLSRFLSLPLRSCLVFLSLYTKYSDALLKLFVKTVTTSWRVPSGWVLCLPLSLEVGLERREDCFAQPSVLGIQWVFVEWMTGCIHEQVKKAWNRVDFSKCMLIWDFCWSVCIYLFSVTSYLGKIENVQESWKNGPVALCISSI